jgi:IclR family acetate operon transcriptional repressor
MAPSNASGTGSLEKALDVLDAVGASPQGLSQSDITQRLALPRTTTYRLLATLVARGLLRRDPLRQLYCLGFRCFEMARQAYATPDLVSAAAPELRALRDLTGETAYLASLDGHDVISLDRCDGAHSQRSAASLGQRKPVYCTSQGKAILSAMAPDAREALVRELTLKPLTPLTLTDRRRLLAELKIIAARGWAMDDEEIVLGVRCVGAPVVDAQGEVRGAISVAAPAWRFTRERVALLGPDVAEAARRIGAQLRSAATAVDDAPVKAIPGPWAFEGNFPLWDRASGRLYWSDVLAPSLRVYANANGVSSADDAQLAEIDTPVTGLVLQGSDVLVAHEAGVWRVTASGQHAPVTAWPKGRLLALCQGADGSLWAAYKTPTGGSAVGQVRGSSFEPQWQLVEAVQALHWNHGFEALYATVPASGELLVLRTGSSGASSVRRLATIPKGSGRISGLALDDAGGLWTALRDGWSVMRVAPDGSLDRVVGLPVPCPTGVAIGGAGGKSLFITTARQPVALDALANAPLSGRLLVTTV